MSNENGDDTGDFNDEMESAESESIELEIETAIGPVTVRDTQIADTPREFSPVDDEFRANVQTLAEKAGPEFVAYYLPDVVDPQLRHYDEAFGKWLDDEFSPFADEAVIWILGSVFGETCRRALEMEWTCLTDEFGSDFAVRDTKVELMTFPFSTIGKRIETREREFLVDIFYVLAERAQSSDYRERDD